MTTVGVLGLFALSAHAADYPFVTTSIPLTLVSINDGEVISVFGNTPGSNHAAQDSITVIQLTPDAPPKSRTVYGTVQSSIIGAPYLALTKDGRYAVVPTHTIRFPDMVVPSDDDPQREPKNLVSVVDLASPSLTVKTLELKGTPIAAAAHPDGTRILVGGGQWLHVIKLKDGAPVLSSSVQVPMNIGSFALSPDGKSLLATGESTPTDPNLPYLQQPIAVHLLAVNPKGVAYRGPITSSANSFVNGPFALRFAPDGSQAFVPNGFGWESKGGLDGLVFVDMHSASSPVASGLVPGLGDGLESLAVHPNGTLVVVSCLDGWEKGSKMSHLAVIDATERKLLYHLPIEQIPEGIEFTPSGDRLFVGLSAVNHIAVFDVDGFALKRHSAVLVTGHGPSIMGLEKSYRAATPVK